MNTPALILMITTQLTVVGFTIYFFRKVLKAPKKSEPDSYVENDDLS